MLNLETGLDRSVRTVQKHNFFKRKDTVGWLVMLPTLILFAFFVWEPLLESIRLSMYTANGVRLKEFVGFENYITLFRHPDFLAAFKNTFTYILWSLLLGFPIPIRAISLMVVIFSGILSWKV